MTGLPAWARRSAPVGLLAFVVAASLIAPGGALAQLDAGGGGGAGGADRIEGRAKLVPVPYVGYDRSIGFSLGFLPLVQFNPVASDTLSPSSLAGALAMYTTNETWLLMGFGRLYLAADTWRVTAAGGKGSINYQFYLQSPIDQWIPYNTGADFALARLERRTWRDLFVGVSYTYTRFDTTLEGVPDSFGTTLHGLGLNASVDRRSSVYYPRAGFFSNAKYRTYPEAFDNEFVSNVVELDTNHYFAARRAADVVAARAYAGLGIGDLSFNQQFIVGQTDIRGYTQGEFRGNYLVALQGEYRWNFRPRLGLVGFLGLATVFDAINPDHDGRILPGIGAGFRFTAFTETHMNVGLDAAVGDGDWGIYFRVGEAF